MNRESTQTIRIPFKDCGKIAITHGNVRISLGVEWPEKGGDNPHLIIHCTDLVDQSTSISHNTNPSSMGDNPLSTTNSSYPYHLQPPYSGPTQSFFTNTSPTTMIDGTSHTDVSPTFNSIQKRPLPVPNDAGARYISDVRFPSVPNPVYVTNHPNICTRNDDAQQNRLNMQSLSINSQSASHNSHFDFQQAPPMNLPSPNVSDSSSFNGVIFCNCSKAPQGHEDHCPAKNLNDPRMMPTDSFSQPPNHGQPLQQSTNNVRLSNSMGIPIMPTKEQGSTYSMNNQDVSMFDKPSAIRSGVQTSPELIMYPQSGGFITGNSLNPPQNHFNMNCQSRPTWSNSVLSQINYPTNMPTDGRSKSSTGVFGSARRKRTVKQSSAPEQINNLHLDQSNNSPPKRRTEEASPKSSPLTKVPSPNHLQAQTAPSTPIPVRTPNPTPAAKKMLIVLEETEASKDEANDSKANLDQPVRSPVNLDPSVQKIETDQEETQTNPVDETINSVARGSGDIPIDLLPLPPMSQQAKITTTIQNSNSRFSQPPFSSLPLGNPKGSWYSLPLNLSTARLFSHSANHNLQQIQDASSFSASSPVKRRPRGRTPKNKLMKPTCFPMTTSCSAQPFPHYSSRAHEMPSNTPTNSAEWSSQNLTAHPMAINNDVNQSFFSADDNRHGLTVPETGYSQNDFNDINVNSQTTAFDDVLDWNADSFLSVHDERFNASTPAFSYEQHSTSNSLPIQTTFIPTSLTPDNCDSLLTPPSNSSSSKSPENKGTSSASMSNDLQHPQRSIFELFGRKSDMNNCDHQPNESSSMATATSKVQQQRRRSTNPKDLKRLSKASIRSTTSPLHKSTFAKCTNCGALKLLDITEHEFPGQTGLVFECLSCGNSSMQSNISSNERQHRLALIAQDHLDQVECRFCHQRLPSRNDYLQHLRNYH